VWNDWLIAVANMDAKEQKTSLNFHSPQMLGISPQKDYSLFDIHRHFARSVKGDSLDSAFNGIPIPGENLDLFYLREQPADAPFHVWGGKRISERWDVRSRELTLEIHGPPGLQDTIFIAVGRYGIQQVEVAGKPADFLYDPSQGLVHGQVIFTTKPLKIEVRCSPANANTLPGKPVAADALVHSGVFDSETQR